MEAFASPSSSSAVQGDGASAQQAAAAAGLSACAFSSIPVLDLGRFTSGSQEERQAFISDLQYTAHAVGFFYVVGHGLAPDFDTRAINAARRFFCLPDEAKATVDYAQSPSFRGYMAQGVENTGGKVDQREQFEYGLDFPPLSQDVCAVQPPYRRLHGPNQWPEEACCRGPGVRQELQAFMASMRQVAEALLQALALGAGLPQGAFTDDPQPQPQGQGMMDPDQEQERSLHANGMAARHALPASATSAPEPPYMTVKAVRYPPTQGGTRAGGEGPGARAGYGVGPHTDSGLITLLVQDDVGGLEALSGSGTSARWVAVPPRQGAIVVNLGELLQAATGGYYVATVHRVVNADPSRERISLPFFYNARLAQRMAPARLPASLRWQRPPPSQDSITHGGANRLLQVAGENVLKSFVRSHPHVARRHHPDLFA